nr:hypothetical protein [Acholeplasmatales bacterium]
LIDRVDYSYVTDGDGNKTANNASYAHNIIGVVNTAGVVCEGYTKCYKLLCDIYGLTTIVVTGTAETSSGSGGHAWNYTMVDENWYGVDVTWDDQKIKSSQDNYLLVSKSTMEEEHTPFGSEEYGLSYNVSLPTLSSSNYHYSYI